MALDVVIVSGSGQEYVGCLLLTSEVLFVVSISEDTQQQAFPVTEIDCMEDQSTENCLLVQLKQQSVPSELEVSVNLPSVSAWWLLGLMRAAYTPTRSDGGIYFLPMISLTYSFCLVQTQDGRCYIPSSQVYM